MSCLGPGVTIAGCELSTWCGDEWTEGNRLGENRNEKSLKCTIFLIRKLIRFLIVKVALIYLDRDVFIGIDDGYGPLKPDAAEYTEGVCL